MEVGASRFLLDCGLKDAFSLLLALQKIRDAHSTGLPLDFIICSHAHWDHVQSLYQLNQVYPKIPIYLTEATAHLLTLHWPEQNLTQLQAAFCIVPWKLTLEVTPELSLAFLPAGHFPGAAAAFLTYRSALAGESAANATASLLYTGDSCLANTRMTDALPLQIYRTFTPDILIVSGCLGTDSYPNRRRQEAQLLQHINTALEDGQSLLIPRVQMGMMPELIMLLRTHPQFVGKDIDIWIHEAVAQECDHYLKILHLLPKPVSNLATTQPLFFDEQRCPRLRRFSEACLEHLLHAPAIVLTPAKVNLAPMLERAEGLWNLLILDQPWQEDSLLSGEDQATPEVMLDARLGPRGVAQQLRHWLASDRLRMTPFVLTQHSDLSGTLQLIHNLKPQHVVFIHGSPAKLEDLTNLDGLINRYHLHLPYPDKPFELLLGQDKIQLDLQSSERQPDQVLPIPVEIQDQSGEIFLKLPQTLRGDPHWDRFTETGLMRATWQGEDLLLQPVSQQNLLELRRQRVKQPGDCCSNCQFYQNQHCASPASPLSGLAVDPTGLCPQYQPSPGNSSAR